MKPKYSLQQRYRVISIFPNVGLFDVLCGLIREEAAPARGVIARTGITPKDRISGDVPGLESDHGAELTSRMAR